MGKLIEERMPERVRQVDFTENARIPTGLTRAVQSSEVRSIFLEKGCVVVRELVEEEGRRVVKSVALPLNSGLVRTILLEDEVVEEKRCPNWPEGATAHVCESCDPEAVRKLNEEYGLSAGGGRVFNTPADPKGYEGARRALSGEALKDWPTTADLLGPDATKRLINIPSPADAHRDSLAGAMEARTGSIAGLAAPVGGLAQLDPSPENFKDQPVPATASVVQEQTTSEVPATGEHVPANAEEALLNRRPRRR